MQSSTVICFSKNCAMTFEFWVVQVTFFNYSKFLGKFNTFFEKFGSPTTLKDGRRLLREKKTEHNLYFSHLHSFEKDLFSLLVWWEIQIFRKMSQTFFQNFGQLKKRHLKYFRVIFLEDDLWDNAILLIYS